MSKTIREMIKGANRIGVSGHIRPDGDCIGSTVGMYLYLKKIAPNVYIKLFLEDPNTKFSYLKGFDEIDTTYADKEQYDVFFSMDCSTTDRLGQAEQLFLNAKHKVCFDHHISNVGFGDECYVQPKASSACEVLFGFIPDEELDEDIAKALYTGIIHDTGVLQYSNSSPKTFRIVARLIEFGFDFPTIIDESFYKRTYPQNLILGKALVESRLLLDGKVICTVVDKATMDERGLTPKDLDGIVNQIRITEGVHVAIFLYEAGKNEAGETDYKVSMRADDTVNVSEIATGFGGGGHVKAAGCNLYGDVETVLSKLTEKIALQLS